MLTDLLLEQSFLPSTHCHKPTKAQEYSRSMYQLVMFAQSILPIIPSFAGPAAHAQRLLQRASQGGAALGA